MLQLCCQDANVFHTSRSYSDSPPCYIKKNNKKHKTKTSLSFPNSLQLLSELAEETVFREFTDKPVK